MKNKDFKGLSASELQAELLALRKEQFKLRMKKASGSLDKPHLLKHVRREIARVKTEQARSKS